ncbi:hypothetical protein bsdcttw_43670 [Anaerocolumna chitinilytica]|uniref:Uncharacterized protein n=1 Tax=Anaerocolumna chitinilytica TaxID=1727145 RepID=A0A7M3S9Q9_9FIRM|nr:hypothetical protein bsdcttw_43670 [Anaerocolumna chitinilytica]
MIEKIEMSIMLMVQEILPLSKHMTSCLRLLIRSGDKRRLRKVVGIGVLILIMRKSSRINRA